MWQKIKILIILSECSMFSKISNFTIKRELYGKVNFYFRCIDSDFKKF